MATDIKNDATLSTSLVSVWLSDESGLTTDLHGSNDLTNSGVTLSAGGGKNGDAGDFEATETDYEYITDASQSGLDYSTAFSFSAWMYLEDTITTRNRYFVRKVGSTSDRAYETTFFHSGSNKLRFALSGNGSTFVFTDITLLSNLSASTWYHVVLTYNAGACRLWINGVDQGGGTSSVTSLFNSGGDFTIGGAGAPHDGLIHQMATWSKKLADSEIADLYNSGTGIPYDAGGGGGFAYSQSIVMV